jgi:hypothetical protein
MERWHPLPRIFAAGLAAAALVVGIDARAFAQDRSDRGGSLVGRVAKGVLLDPTTYTPAVLSYGGMRLDWDSSQVFFQHGFIERNARFTMSGLPNDLPLGYHSGNHRIVSIALDNLQTSLVNNISDRIVEEWLLAKYPDHPRLVKTIGWVERIGFASYLSYLRAGPHFKQWQQNQRLAGEMGLR